MLGSADGVPPAGIIVTTFTERGELHDRIRMSRSTPRGRTPPSLPELVNDINPRRHPGFGVKNRMTAVRRAAPDGGTPARTIIRPNLLPRSMSQESPVEDALSPEELSELLAEVEGTTGVSRLR